jgi:hypothetical protein
VNHFVDSVPSAVASLGDEVVDGLVQERDLRYARKETREIQQVREQEGTKIPHC